MMIQFRCPKQGLHARNVETMRPSIGQSKQEEEMKVPQNSIDAQSANILGAGTDYLTDL